MNMWEELEDLETHWKWVSTDPLEGALHRKSGADPAASSGKGMFTNFVGLASFTNTLMMNFSFPLCQFLLFKKTKLGALNHH